MPNELSPDDWRVINAQRVITAAVNKDVVKVGAIFLRPTSKLPVDENWADRQFLDTNLQDWVDAEDRRMHNVGFNLQQGWVDIDIDGDDSQYNRCIYNAFTHIGIDCRLAFGRLSCGVPRHLLVQLSEEETRNFDEFKKFEPKEVRLGNRRYFTEIRSSSAKAKDAKQAVVPGSIYGEGGSYDISVWWRGTGEIATNIYELAPTTPRIVPFNQLLRGIAFGTILFLVQGHWVEGSRQIIASKLSGWLARVVDESQAMNNSEQLSREVLCPIDDDKIAEALIEFICNSVGDDEVWMRKRTFRDARIKLERNPDAKIPGWPSMKELLGEETVIALRAVCIPGADVSVLMGFSDRYVYNQTGGLYIDRERFKQGNQAFEHSGEELIRRHKPDIIIVGGKPREAFKWFEGSKLRLSVGNSDMWPSQKEGEIFRLSRSHGVVSDEYSGDDSYLVFNTWRGWDIKPINDINDAIINQCNEKLDQVLLWLTSDNRRHVEWIKDWFAWTIQHPGEKQQVAWVVVGSQGVGKSFIGNTFCGALFGTLHGTITGKTFGERFSTAPFMNKMFVFADEVKTRGPAAVEEIKLLVRQTKMLGELKGIDGRDYNIFARLMFASNNVNINIGQSDVVDRALYFTRTYNPEYMGLTPAQFAEWVIRQKPFFDDFNQFLQNPNIIAHYMRMFMDRAVNRHRIEDTTDSAARDPKIMEGSASGPRRIAKLIIEEGRVFEDLDISTPFNKSKFIEYLEEKCKKLGELRIRGTYVFEEFENLALLEKFRAGAIVQYRFKWLHGTLIQKFAESTGLNMDSQFEFGPGDYGENTNEGTKPVPWKGAKRHKF